MRALLHALRGLRRTPIATAGVLLTLIIAISANVAVFSLVNGLLLRPLPVRDPARLVTVSSDEAIRLGFPAGPGWSYGMWDRLRARSGVVEGAAAWFMRDVNLAPAGEKRLASALVASGSFFDTLGLDVARGRAFTNDDDVRGGGAAGPVVVISHRFWDRHFQRAPDAIGRPLIVEGVTYRVVGVLPASFRGLEVGRPIDLVLPLETEPLMAGRASIVASERALMLIAMLRLRAGQSLPEATAALRAIQPEIVGSGRLPRFVEEPFTLVPAAQGTSAGGLRTRYGRAATTMLGLVVLIWLATCANVANLQMARMTARTPELVVRRALGASRRRLAGTLSLEALLLAVVATGSGVLAGMWASRMAASEILATSADALDLSMDAATLAYIGALALLATALFGVLPAWRVTGLASAALAPGRLDPVRAGQRHGWATSLVVVQLAISFVLIVGASQFVRTAAATAATPLGYDAARVIVVTIDGPRTDEDDEAGRLRARQLVDALGAIPGVARAAQSTSVPGQTGLTTSIGGDGTAERRVRVTAVTPEWFATYGTRVIAGRGFGATDVDGAPGVAIVNRALAAALWPGRTAVGTRVDEREVVGVVEDHVTWGGFTPEGVARGVSDPPAPTLYVPLGQHRTAGPPGSARVQVSLRLDGAANPELAAAVARVVASVDTRLSFTLRHLAGDVRVGLAHQRILGHLSASLGVLAVIVALVGLYSVVAQDLHRRQRELGVRLALGARPDRLAVRVVWRAARLVVPGALAGAAMASALAPLVEPLLYDGRGREPLTFAAAAAGLAIASVVAAAIPGTRACRRPAAELLRRGE